MQARSVRNLLGTLSDWHWRIVLLFVFSIPLSQYLSARLLAILAVISLFQWRPEVMLRRSWDILIFFFLALAGLLYTADMPFGISVLETMLGLLLIPLAWSAGDRMDENRLQTMLLVFIGSVTIGSLVCLAVALGVFLETGSPDAFLYYNLTGLLDFQPTYYAYYLVFAITASLHIMSSDRSPVRPWLMALVVLLLFGVLLLTGGRTSFISLLLILAFHILKFLVEAGDARQKFKFAVVLVMLIFLFIAAGALGSKSEFSDAWDRYEIWVAALRTNHDPWLGVGTGDHRTELNNYFKARGLERYASESLNAHNQFIQTYLSIGVAGLLSLLLMIGRPIFLGTRRDSALPILMMFPFLIYGMTEVFLGRYQGVVFFGLVHQWTLSYLLPASHPTYVRKEV